jgi:hypothetical protein
MARIKRTVQKQQPLKAKDVLAEAVRIASEAREASVTIDWSVSARTPLEGKIRMKLLHRIEIEEFALQSSTHHPLSWVAMRIRQRLKDFMETIPDDSESIGADLMVMDNKWLAFYEAELEKETEARQAQLRASVGRGA